MPNQDSPDRIREWLTETPPGDWFVFETFAADGSLAVGVAQGDPDPTAVLIVYQGLTEPVARAAAHDLDGWHRSQGRDIAIT